MPIIAALVGIVLGAIAAIAYMRTAKQGSLHEADEKIQSAHAQAESLIGDAKRQAETLKKEALLEAKEEIIKNKQAAEAEDRPHDLEPHRLRSDRLCPPADSQRDGKAGQPLRTGGLCPRDRHALRGLCGQPGQADDGRRPPRAESLAGRGRGDRRTGRRPPQAAGPPPDPGTVCCFPAGHPGQRAYPRRAESHRPVV